MLKEKGYIPMPLRIKEATKKLKSIGYVVFTEDDEKFAILAEKQKIVCNNTKEFFNTVDKLTKKNNQE
jgi:hypothetical protein